MAVGSFEAEAKNAAVEAVERRWKADVAERRRIRRNQRIKNLLAIAFLVLVVIVGGKFASDYFGVEIPFVDQFDWRGFCRNITSGKASEGDVELRNEYAKVLHSFAESELLLWRMAPAAVKPKEAAKGTVYHALVADGKGVVVLFRMIASGDGSVSIVRLSPVAKAADVSFAEFKSHCAKGTYFIECKGQVYYCGKDGLDSGRLILWQALAKSGLDITNH